MDSEQKLALCVLLAALIERDPAAVVVWGGGDKVGRRNYLSMKARAFTPTKDFEYWCRVAGIKPEKLRGISVGEAKMIFHKMRASFPRRKKENK